MRNDVKRRTESSLDVSRNFVDAPMVDKFPTVVCISFESKSGNFPNGGIVDSGANFSYVGEERKPQHPTLLSREVDVHECRTHCHGSERKIE